MDPSSTKYGAKVERGAILKWKRRSRELFFLLHGHTENSLLNHPLIDKLVGYLQVVAPSKGTFFVMPSQQSWRGYSNAAVHGWLGEWVGGWVRSWVRGSVPLYLVDTIATIVFAQSLSNFTCKLSMMRGGTLLILGHGVKGQGQLWHSVYKTLWTR